MTELLPKAVRPEETFGHVGRRRLHVERLAHVRAHMRSRGVGAMVLLDPASIRYVTGSSNMENFSVRVPARYLLVLEPGPTVLYEYRGCEHLGLGLPTVTEVRFAEGLDVVSSDDDVGGTCRRFADEIAGVIRDVDQSIDSVAIDRLPFQAVDELRRHGFTLTDAHQVLVPARVHKLPIEIDFMREVMRRTELAVAEMEQMLVPGATEAEVWATFHRGLIAREGEYTASRLFQSGPRTYPYFQECSDRPLAAGDLVCLDTDAVGLEGYCADFSRAFLCGDGIATEAQRSLYAKAREQLEWNAALLKPAVTFEEIAREAWPIPPEHSASRYYCIGHGLGIAGDFPNIPHLRDDGPYPVRGALEPGMVFCIESYIGSSAVGQGVKLEDEFLITATDAERISRYPFDPRLGGA